MSLVFTLILSRAGQDQGLILLTEDSGMHMFRNTFCYIVLESSYCTEIGVGVIPYVTADNTPADFILL